VRASWRGNLELSAISGQVNGKFLVSTYQPKPGSEAVEFRGRVLLQDIIV